jgi:hypothetical protein
MDRIDVTTSNIATRLGDARPDDDTLKGGRQGTFLIVVAGAGTGRW